MVNIFKSLLTFAAASSAMLSVSCNILDLDQSDKLNRTNMWIEESDAVTATRGIYERLRNSFAQSKANPFFWGELRVGPGMWGKGTGRSLADNDMLDVLLNTLNASDASTRWNYLYTTIDQCNQVIKYSPSIKMSESALDYCLGNAYFVRAYCYFWIARVWGDAPLILTPTEGVNESIYPVRQPVNDLYTQISADITSALEYIKDDSGRPYYATVDNLNLLKADFSLWMYSAAKAGDSWLDEAKEALDSVSNEYLDSDFANVFKFDNKDNKEISFSVHMKNGEVVGSSWYGYFIWGSTQIKPEYRNKEVPVSSNQWLLYSDSFIEFLKASKERGDQRTDVTYMEKEGVSDIYDIVQWPNKFTGNTTTGTMIWEQDFILYRYAQFYTFYAEYYYHKKDYGNALKQLNILAKRAYDIDGFYTDISRNAVKKAIVDENLKEFAEEGNVYFTLIRMDAIQEFNPYRYEEGLGQCGVNPDRPNQLLMPIAKDAINRNNKLVQTEGWS